MIFLIKCHGGMFASARFCYLGELGDNVFEDVGRGVMQERLKSGKMHALLEDVFQRLLCLQYFQIRIYQLSTSFTIDI